MKLGLFGKALIAIALGAVVGMCAPEFLVRIFKTFNVMFGQFLRFIVPLLILGLVTPAIADVGKGAGKLLITVMLTAYLSTIASGFLAFGITHNLFPHILPQGIADTTAAAKQFLPYINLKIPPVCDVMTALALAFLCGVSITIMGGETLRKVFDDLGKTVKMAIEKAVIPLIPAYIFTMICEMSASGRVGALIGAFIKVIAIGIAITWLFLLIEYTLSGIIARKNPFRVLKNLLPAYVTGFSTNSSAIVIPITLAGAKKSGISSDIADFTIPLCANVHMPGSTIKMATSAVAVAYITGFDLTPEIFANFVLMQAIAAVAAPGVATGVLMASMGLLESVIGFNSQQISLLMTVYIAVDGYGAACSVTADGALALGLDRFFGKKSSTAENI